MASERRLWLVRHGETEGQSSIRYHGANDVPLSDLGRSQIRALLPLLANVSFAQVVHSPLSRATESAQLLVDGLGGLGIGIRGQGIAEALPIRSDDRLREISFGACEGLTRDEIDSAHPTFWADYEAGRLDAFPAGESRTAFASRIASAATDLAAGDWRGDTLLVAHRGTVKHTLMALLPDTQSQPQPNPSTFAVDLASLSVLRETPNGWTLELLGMTGDFA